MLVAADYTFANGRHIAEQAFDVEAAAAADRLRTVTDRLVINRQPNEVVANGPNQRQKLHSTEPLGMGSCCIGRSTSDAFRTSY